MRPFLIANVHSSDRPPLETALSLEQYPFWRLLSILHSYQLLGVALQCLWVAGIWILLRASGISPPAAAAVLSLIFLTGFAWQHSFYVWPKLLSAAFCLLGLAAVPMFRGSSEKWRLRDVIASSTAFSLSLLSHTGSGFTILAILLILTVRRRLPALRLAAIAAGIVLALLVPWRAYQVLADPPGDALFKLHLAGVTDEKLSLGASLLRGYGGLSSSQIASRKLANFEALFARPVKRAGTDWKVALLNLVDLSFFSFFPCAGLLNLGLLARLRLKRTSSQVRFADRLLLLSVISLVIWCLLMFEAGSTVVHQGSFATVLLYFVATALYLHAWSIRAVLGVIALQACLIFPVLVILEPVITRPSGTVWNDPLDLGMATAALCSFLALAALAVYVGRQRELH